jgi:hypothetical protein
MLSSASAYRSAAYGTPERIGEQRPGAHYRSRRVGTSSSLRRGGRTSRGDFRRTRQDSLDLGPPNCGRITLGRPARVHAFRRCEKAGRSTGVAVGSVRPRARALCPHPPGTGDTVLSVASRPVIDLELTIDAAPTLSETTYTWAGAHVLTVHTVVPHPDLALELHSTFVGHTGVPTHVVHLRLGPPGHEPALTTVDIQEGETEPTYAPRACVYEHAQRLIEALSDLGYRGGVNVADESAFAALERIGPRTT